MWNNIQTGTNFSLIPFLVYQPLAEGFCTVIYIFIFFMFEGLMFALPFFVLCVFSFFFWQPVCLSKIDFPHETKWSRREQVRCGLGLGVTSTAGAQWWWSFCWSSASWWAVSSPPPPSLRPVCRCEQEGQTHKHNVTFKIHHCGRWHWDSRARQHVRGGTTENCSIGLFPAPQHPPEPHPTTPTHTIPQLISTCWTTN